MNSNFYGAILGFGVAVVTTLVIGHSRMPATVHRSEAAESCSSPRRFPPVLVLLAGIILCLCAALNVCFW
jgi:hypothetical protein